MIKQLLFITVFWMLSNAASAIEAINSRGLEIITEVDRRDTGFGDVQMDMVMILRNKSGDESLRSLSMKTLEIVGDGDKSLTIFDRPRDIKGTAFLSFTHPLTADEQWLYLPALKRVKRISSSNKSGPFLGSEYAFEDLTSFEIPKFSYRFLRAENYQERPCFVLEFIPQYPYSGYTREQVWIDSERYIPVKVDYYDRKNALLKTLIYQGYQQYLKQFWRADGMVMTNHQTGKSTQLMN
ncbi:MAG: outer membrane lipoprotein-sorting protein, partial [Methylococcales bacterium]|nr:outer membrane lipoprotein-sorting protein [Methylococcales bacterium]